MQSLFQLYKFIVWVCCLLVLSWWLLSFAEAHTITCPGNTTLTLSECNALMDFYDSTQGTWWINNSGRDTNTNACNWYGIACINVAWQNRIYAISGNNNNLTGSLPASLSALTKINQFNVRGNHLRGTLPSSYSAWTEIQDFQVQSNHLVGVLPDSYSAWQNIHVFYVDVNQLTGVLPDAWSAWGSDIRWFSVGANQLTGILPSSWASWTNMRYFSVQGNQLQWRLPSSWSTWTQVATLYLTNNQFVWQLPDAWSAMTRMRYFRAAYNQLQWLLPSAWSTWGLVRRADFSHNAFVGYVPSSRYNNRSSIGAVYKGLDFKNNCIYTVGYSAAMENWLTANAYMTPQNVCESIFYTLQYFSSIGGTIVWSATQAVLLGWNGIQVEAVAQPWYVFHHRSDGSLSNPRTDLQVMHDITVTAFFVKKWLTVIDPSPMRSSNGWGDILVEKK